jgi:hypothetical protein
LEEIPANLAGGDKNMTTEINNATIYTTDDESEQVIDTPQESFALLDKWEHRLATIEKIHSDDSHIIWKQETETIIEMCENGEKVEEAAVIVRDIKKCRLTIYDSWVEFLSSENSEKPWEEHWLKIKEKELLRLALIKIGKEEIKEGKK